MLHSCHTSKVSEYQEHKASAGKSRNRRTLEGNSSSQNDTKKPCLDNKKQVCINEAQKRTPKDEIENRVIKYIVKEMLPLHTVEKESFRELVQGTVLCRKTLSVQLQDKSVARTSDLRNRLSQEIAVCTTTDVWSCMKRSYLGVTAHWVAADLTRQSAALACRRLKGSHTYDIIADALLSILTQYGLDHRSITFAVTDNGANMVKAFREYQQTESSLEDSMDDGESDDELAATDYGSRTC